MNKSKSGKNLFCKSIKTKHSFIQQIFIETYFVLGTVPGAKDIVVSKTGKHPCLKSINILVGMGRQAVNKK